MQNRFVLSKYNFVTIYFSCICLFLFNVVCLAFLNTDRSKRFGKNKCFQRTLAQKKKKKRTEEHTSELQSRDSISYAVFCLKKKKTTKAKSRPYQHSFWNSQFFNRYYILTLGFDLRDQFVYYYYVAVNIE
eukprot:TRINITY_DN2176_c1_g1_i9.p3 TRINITY_DN2176_c1_g1~~TRINITY_DN2176_c1_g1_i9.p3  ORF type:complete len:131 (+),score=10.62 TRINITY_DN2176_c1_g1_i9:650-1042(+)